MERDYGNKGAEAGGREHVGGISVKREANKIFDLVTFINIKNKYIADLHHFLTGSACVGEWIDLSLL